MLVCYDFGFSSTLCNYSIGSPLPIEGPYNPHSTVDHCWPSLRNTSCTVTNKSADLFSGKSRKLMANLFDFWLDRSEIKSVIGHQSLCISLPYISMYGLRSELTFRGKLDHSVPYYYNKRNQSWAEYCSQDNKWPRSTLSVVFVFVFERFCLPFFSESCFSSSVVPIFVSASAEFFWSFNILPFYIVEVHRELIIQQ